MQYVGRKINILSMLSLSNRSFRPVIISNGEFHLNPVFLLNTTQTQVQNFDIYIDKITKLKGLLSHWVEILGREYQFYIIRYRFLTTDTNESYTFHCLFITSLVKLLVVNVQIFVQNCVFWKKKKQHSQNLSHFENKKTFRKRTAF